MECFHFQLKLYVKADGFDMTSIIRGYGSNLVYNTL